MKNSKIGKKVYLRSFGCQMNEYDSELIRGILDKAGFKFIDSQDNADVILLNTCSVRESATRKFFGHVHALRYSLKNKNVLIGVLGCIASDQKEKLIKNKKLGIDFVVGPDSYRRLPRIINQVSESGNTQLDVLLSPQENYADLSPIRESSSNAWIAIMRGCNNFCSFCIVPYVRGRERSRSPDDIINEAYHAADSGFKQITLLGQNVNSYSYENNDFVDLLYKISLVDNIKRIRFMSPHPKDFSEKLIKFISENKKMCKHIHLPLQSGNDRILDLMNRRYTQKQYLGLVDKIRKYCPDIVFSTDVIVGFPTETDKEFDDTLCVIKEVRFDSAFMFKYSPREGTAAAKDLNDDVSEAVKTNRIVRLNEIQKQISLERNQECVGNTYEVLIEEESSAKSNNVYQGRTDTNKLVLFPKGKYSKNEFVTVKCDNATPHALKGNIVESCAISGV